jgi:type VI secretion system secreted protein VgrG
MATSVIPEAKFVSAGLGENDLVFRRLKGVEALGDLPEYRIELHRPTRKTAVAPKELLGRPACIHLRLPDDSLRYIHGLVTRFERGGAVGSYDVYHVELRPWLWLLTLGADCRIYQDMDAVEIIKSVFNEYKGDIEIKLDGTFRKRPYTVQYRESDYAFVSRLMEEEGVYHYFKHEAAKHTLVLCNSARAHTPIKGEKLLWAPVQTERQLRTDVIQAWSQSNLLRSLKYTHTDFAAEATTTSLKGEASWVPGYPTPNDLEVFDYPGGYEDVAMIDGQTGAKTQEAKRLAQLRVDAYESGYVVAGALTPCRHVAPGLTFDFADYPKLGDAAGSFLVTAANYDIEFAGQEANVDTESAGFSCRFDAVPKAVKFQPQPEAVRPVIQGPQTATVVGPAGDEIHTDKYGRVKVFFHWDRVGKKDGTTSCWVRVSTPWASNKFGMVALPRIGDEVVVDFLEGNPDRPLITGRVYNGTNMPPWELPAQATVSGIKTRSSKGGKADNANELRFDDATGKEYVWFQAEKDFHRWVKNDSWDTVNRDLWTDIDRDSQHTVGGKYAMTIAKTATVKVDSDVSVKLGADALLQVTGALNAKVDDPIIVQGGHSIVVTSGREFDLNVAQSIKLTGGSSVHVKGIGVVIDGGTSLTIKAGSGSVVLDAGGVTITGALVKINSGGSPGSAEAAARANPAAPKEPDALADNKDPLKP